MFNSIRKLVLKPNTTYYVIRVISPYATQPDNGPNSTRKPDVKRPLHSELVSVRIQCYTNYHKSVIIKITSPSIYTQLFHYEVVASTTMTTPFIEKKIIFYLLPHKQ